MMVREVVLTYREATKAGPVGRALRSPDDSVAVAREIIPDGPQERFVVLGVNTKNRVVAWNLVGVGGLGSCGVVAAEVFRWALIAGVRAIVLAHNHPSGDPEPSQDDTALTRRLADAGQLLGVPVLDHVILGAPGKWFSYCSAGIDVGLGK